MRVPLDKTISVTMAALLTGVLLFAAWFFSGGFYGDEPRSLETGLAACGGSLGFWGGVALFVAVALAGYAVHEVSNFAVGYGYVRALEGRGLSPEAVASKIDRLPVSRGLKRRLLRVRKHT